MRAERFPSRWRRSTDGNVSVASVVVSLCVFTGAFFTILQQSGSSEGSPATAESLDAPGVTPGAQDAPSAPSDPAADVCVPPAGAAVPAPCLAGEMP